MQTNPKRTVSNRKRVISLAKMKAELCNLSYIFLIKQLTYIIYSSCNSQSHGPIIFFFFFFFFFFCFKLLSNRTARNVRRFIEVSRASRSVMNLI